MMDSLGGKGKKGGFRIPVEHVTFRIPAVNSVEILGVYQYLRCITQIVVPLGALRTLHERWQLFIGTNDPEGRWDALFLR